MSTPLRLLGLIVLVLLVPAVPFLLLGDTFEQQLLDWLRADVSDGAVAAAVVGLLSADLFLPVPSTAVSTYAGGVLGWTPAVAASWLGLMLGNLIGFTLARLGGRPFAERYARPADLQALDRLGGRYGVWVLVVTRALPLVAEAAVLLMGATRISWTRFLCATAAANFAVVAVYVTLGTWFRNTPVLPAAVLASAVFPLLLALAFRRQWLRPAEAQD